MTAQSNLQGRVPIREFDNVAMESFSLRPDPAAGNVNYVPSFPEFDDSELSASNIIYVPNFPDFDDSGLRAGSINYIPRFSEFDDTGTLNFPDLGAKF